jgi:hypothetical protein
MAITKVVPTPQRQSGGNITTSITVAAGDVIVAMATSQDSNTNNIGCGGITRDGQSFTKRGGAGGSGGAGVLNYAECWYLTNPTAGTNNAVASFNGTINECSITYYVLSGADAASLFNGTDDSDTTSGVPPSMSITTDRDECYLIAVLTSEGAISGVGAGQDTDATLTDQSFENTKASSKTGGAAGAQSMSFTAPSNQYAQYMVAINPAPVFYPGRGYFKRQAVNRASRY